jgi:DeoR/GlpR family transcriptional regulator of sugar metabolism
VLTCSIFFDYVSEVMRASVPRSIALKASTSPAIASSARLPAEIRQARLVEAARRRGFLLVTDVAAELGVSEMTIRRDLVELERNGVLHRTRGGAIVVDGEGASIIDREEPAFDARLRRNLEAKQRIAVRALEEIAERTVIALDVGSTSYVLAQHLADRAGCKFFTSSLRIASVLAGAGRDVYVPGGQVRGEEMSICGAEALEQFERYWFDVAFIGVSGLTADGIFDYSLEDSELKRVYLRRAAHKVLLCDGSKFNRMSLVRIADFRAIDLLITDVQPPADIAAALAAAEVPIYVVSPTGTHRAL